MAVNLAKTDLAGRAKVITARKRVAKVLPLRTNRATKKSSGKVSQVQENCAAKKNTSKAAGKSKNKWTKKEIEYYSSYFDEDFWNTIPEPVVVKGKEGVKQLLDAMINPGKPTAYMKKISKEYYDSIVSREGNRTVLRINVGKK